MHAAYARRWASHLPRAAPRSSAVTLEREEKGHIASTGSYECGKSTTLLLLDRFFFSPFFFFSSDFDATNAGELTSCRKDEPLRARQTRSSLSRFNLSLSPTPRGLLSMVLSRRRAVASDGGGGTTAHAKENGRGHSTEDESTDGKKLALSSSSSSSRAALSPASRVLLLIFFAYAVVVSVFYTAKQVSG